LLDMLGMRLAEPGQPAAATVCDGGESRAGQLSLQELGANALDRVFSALTLADESDLPRDEYDRPEPPSPSARLLLAEFGERLAVALRGIGVAAGARFQDGVRFAVALTHDVDELGGGGALRSARKAILGFTLHPGSPDARRRRDEARAYLADWRAGCDSAFPLGAIVAAERAFGWTSTCYFLVRHDDPLDGDGRRYRRHLRTAVTAAADAGLEVGLHASYRARDRPGSIAEEAALLADLTGYRPLGLRHHYLRSDPGRLASELREAGLLYDTSVGWAASTGPRAATPYPYRLWDESTQRPGGWELPLYVMDRTLTRYLRLDGEAASDVAIEALEPVAAAGGACALLWHPPNHHPVLSQGYDRAYARVLAWIAARGGVGGSAEQVLGRWKSRVPDA
jgi:hypothetical protein